MLFASSDLPWRIYPWPLICEQTRKDVRPSGLRNFPRPVDLPIQMYGRQRTADVRVKCCCGTKAPAMPRRLESLTAMMEFECASTIIQESPQQDWRQASQIVQDSWARIPSRMDQPKIPGIFGFGSNPTCSVQAARRGDKFESRHCSEAATRPPIIKC